ncbi:MAG: FKBP-type peptidyl-prolyl cis-trans isomerase [Candidatus Melainabacteria bacterium]|nr:FKBP-type peptidyl-prolyl cis-trans isomerase [Candidatus Melainabacteria bacterium]
MKSINNWFSLLLTLSIASSISVAPVDAKKEFSKPKDGATSALGENTKTAPSGVQFKDIKVGTGTEAKFGNIVWIDYKGWVMPDLREFDNTIIKGRPFNMVLGGTQICRGLDEGVIGMKEGGKRLMLIPPELGFPKGAATSRIIPPGSTIKYEVTVVHVGPKLPKKPVAPAKDAAATTGKAPAATPAKVAPKVKPN